MVTSGYYAIMIGSALLGLIILSFAIIPKPQKRVQLLRERDHEITKEYWVREEILTTKKVKV